MPYGLDIFEGLAKVCRQLKVLIEAEHTQSVVDLTAFIPLQGETAVGKLISNLSAKTTVAQIDALATLTAQELARHVELEKSLKENNPKEKANLLRLRARRIATIASNAKIKGKLVDQAVVANLQSLSNSYRTAKTAAALAAKKFKEGEDLLPGTGGEAWRELFDAARKFALKSHPDKVFPELGADTPCPLCQQPLAEGGRTFAAFRGVHSARSRKDFSSMSKSPICAIQTIC